MRKRLRVASCELRVPDQELAGARVAHLRSRNSPLVTRYFPRAFTLIELLVTMVIISIIAAAILGTANAALDSARRSRTQTVINRIHLLLMEKWEGYETRRIDVSPLLMNQINTTINNQVQGGTPYAQAAQWRGRMIADLRLLALRELIKYEMPDRWSDVTGAPLGQSPLAPLFLASRPALAESYLRLSSVTEENEGAECLYALVMLGTGDGEARSQFTDQDISDEDGDGAPEFVDGWGNPIAFLRWAPGYVGRSSYMSAELDPFGPNFDPQLQLAATTDHDPFDLYHRDQPPPKSGSDPNQPNVNLYPPTMRQFVQRLRDDNAAFRLVPLIFSAGPDERYDIVSGREGDPDDKVIATAVNTIALDPCAINFNVTPNDFYLGRPAVSDGADETVDNITNHSIEY